MAKARWPHTTKRSRVRDGERQTHHVTRDPDAPERWDAWDRAHRPDRPRVGQADGCKAARAIINTLTLVCQRCGALVDWRCAKKHARRAKRGRIAKGAGCAGKRCTKRFRPVKFAATQRGMADKLVRGERVLAAWPTNVADTEVWTLSNEAVNAAVARAMQQ